MNTSTTAAFVRGPATWYGYLLIGTFICLLNLQGNVIPFLQAELSLSYRVVSLHSSAMALGIIVTGLLGERVVRVLGRRATLWGSAGGLGAGALLLCVSPGAWASIPSCALIGFCGGLIASSVPAMLADIHGQHRGQAFAEQAILAYTLAVLGPLLTGFFVANGFGWRYPVIIGGAFAFGLIFFFRNATIPKARARTVGVQPRLPAPFWAYWCLLCFSCSLEYSVVLWAPAFLERVVGYSSATAATFAAGFFVGVLAGRIGLRFVLGRIASPRIMIAAFISGFIGFALYWGIGTPVTAVIGIVLLGLCVAPLYPLTMALSLGVARGATDTASARLNLAVGLALLIAPAALGAFADAFGLSLAHLTLPALIAAGLASFIAAGILERRAILPA
jgi:MFS transporter, DHA1 family, inner membrane transport protein